MRNEPDVLENKIVSSSTQRNFIVQSLFFQNGCLIIISEGEPRLGGLSVSISSSAAGSKVNTAKVIPSKYDSIFINTISEKVSLMINGICLVSLHSKTPLNLEDMKVIMQEIMQTISKREGDHDQESGR